MIYDICIAASWIEKALFPSLPISLHHLHYLQHTHSISALSNPPLLLFFDTYSQLIHQYNPNSKPPRCLTCNLLSRSCAPSSLPSHPIPPKSTPAKPSSSQAATPVSVSKQPATSCVWTPPKSFSPSAVSKRAKRQRSPSRNQQDARVLPKCGSSILRTMSLLKTFQSVRKGWRDLTF